MLRYALVTKAIIACLMLAFPTLVRADNIRGTASVIDGDTVEIHGQRIRLYGIDAPESRQVCKKASKDWRCGKDAAFVLADKIGEKPVECERKGKPDRYKRTVAVCRLNGEDLNAWMVSEGWALAYRQYSKAYIPQEKAAKEAKRGVWASEFTFPWEWRKTSR